MLFRSSNGSDYLVVGTGGSKHGGGKDWAVFGTRLSSNGFFLDPIPFSISVDGVEAEASNYVASVPSTGGGCTVTSRRARTQEIISLFVLVLWSVVRARRVSDAERGNAF